MDSGSNFSAFTAGLNSIKFFLKDSLIICKTFHLDMLEVVFRKGLEKNRNTG